MGIAEHQILVRQILIAASASKLCRVWAQNTGMAFRDGRAVHFGVHGGADISGIMNDGRRLEIEVKTGKAKQSDQQKSFEAMINAHNGIYIVARNVEDTMATIQKRAVQNGVTTGSRGILAGTRLLGLTGTVDTEQ